VLSDYFCAHKIMSLKFMQSFADNQITFCLIFAFSFISCYNSNLLSQFRVSQYNSLKVQSWPKFRSRDSFTRNDLIRNSTIVNDFQDPKVPTSIPWRHTHMKLSDGCRNNYVRIAGLSQLSTRLCSQLILRICAATKRVEVPELTLYPGAGNPRYTTEP